MESKDSFILYADNREIFDELDDISAGKLIKAIFEYNATGEVKDLSPLIKIAFIPIKQTLDRNKEKYIEKINKNKENGKKGGRPKKENPKNPTVFEESECLKKKPKKADNDNDNEHDNVHVNDNDIYIASEDKSSTATTAKASKHKYGRFKNVLLKDQELQSLEEEYDNVEELINFLDEYIEMKGYKAKSHYLAIKKWVVDAVAESKIRKEKANKVFKNNFEKREYKNLDNLFDNL